MPIFWKVFIINRCWILSKAFSASIEIIILFLIFQFVNLLYHIDWFMYIEESLHSWNKPNLIMVHELFDVLLNSIWWKFCWGFLHLCSSVIFACSLLFLCCLCLFLVSGWLWPCRMSLEVLFSLQFFGRVSEKQDLVLL